MKARLFVTVIYLVVACISLSGCNLLSDDTSDDTLINVSNDSKMDFDQVTIGFPGPRRDYGAVGAQTKSEYQEYSRAYPYGFIEVEVKDETYAVAPRDYVGVEPLSNGRFTFVLDLAGDNLIVRMEEQ